MTTLSAKARIALRTALTTHPRWEDYKKATGCSIASMGKDDLIAAAKALDIDLNAVTGEKTESENTMKERTIKPADTLLLKYKLEQLADKLEEKERDLCRDILRTVHEKQDGYATARQYSTVNNILSRAEKYGSTASTNAAPVAPPVTAAAPSAAGSAMWEIIKDAARHDLNPLVESMVTRALEGQNTVRIELTRQGDVAGQTDGHQHPMFAKLCRALSARQANGHPVNVWISGPTGSGKTYASRQFAKAAGLEFGFHGSCLQAHELLGYKSPTTGVYETTAFRERWEHGGVILLDELDSYEAGATLALNGIGDGFINFPDRMVERHADCYIIGAGNTWGEGANAAFVGRNRLDAAFLSRFPVKLSWSYDVALEIAVSGNAEWAKRIQAARLRKDAAGMKHLIDPRHTIAGAALIAQGFTSDEAADMTYLAGLSADQIKIVEGR